MLYKKLYGKVLAMNVKKQLHLIFFIAIFIPVMIIGFYLVYNTHSMLLNHYQNQCKSDNIRVKSMLLDMTSSIYNKSNDIASDQTLIDLLGKKYTSKRQSEKAIIHYNKITETIAQDPSIRNIQIYSMNPTLKKINYVSGMDSAFKKRTVTNIFRRLPHLSGLHIKEMILLEIVRLNYVFIRKSFCQRFEVMRFLLQPSVTTS